MLAKEIKYLCLINVFLINTLFSFAQTSQPLQVGINCSWANGNFCSGNPKWFYFEGLASGGTVPYSYEWTTSWDTDTVRNQLFSKKPPTSGKVTLKVTDSSLPIKKSKDLVYLITEVKLQADFTFVGDGSCSQTPITFNSNVSGGTPKYQYSWDFGDYNNSTENDPTHEYIASGCSGIANYNVKMTVTDANLCSTSVDKILYVKKKPHLVFHDTKNDPEFKQCVSGTTIPAFDILLQNNSTDISCVTNYKIDWGDGTAVTNVKSFPQPHTYANPGAFELVITAENTSGCAAIWTKYVYNQSTPAGGNNSTGNTVGCAPKELSFSMGDNYKLNSIGTTYTWDFGDGSETVVWDPNTQGNIITHNYVSSSCKNWPFFYTTTLTVKNGCAESNFRVDNIVIGISPKASIDYGGLILDTICIDQKIELNNSSSNGYYWNGCSSKSNYLWDFGNNQTSTAAVMPPTSWSVPGEYDIILDVSNLCGADKDTFKIVVIEPPDAAATVDKTSGCAPFEPKFTNNSTGEAIKYLWKILPSSGYTFVKGTNASEVPEIKFNQAGSYRVVLYVSNACKTDSVVFNFNVYAKPSGSIANLSNICITTPVIHPGVIFNANGSPVTIFNWTFTGGSPAVASTVDPGEHTYIKTGEHIVNLELQNTCGSVSLTKTFTIQPKPIATVNPQGSICESESFTITGTTITDYTSFIWKTLGNGTFSNDIMLNPVYTPGSQDKLNSGTKLLLIAVGKSPCASDTAEITLTIQKKPTVTVNNNVTICEGNAYDIINTTAGNAASIQWSTSGDGSFVPNPTILNPKYVPGSNDKLTGHATLTFTAKAKSPCLADATGTFVITYAKVPTIDAGSNQDICMKGQVSLNASGTGITSVTWSDKSFAGSFSNPKNATTTFTLNPGFSGSQVVLEIEATGGYGCANVKDFLTLSVKPLPTAVAGADGVVCESGTYKITDASVTQSSNYHWIVNGDGTLDNKSVLNPVYTPKLSDITNGSVTLTLSAQGNIVCPVVTDEVTIRIQKLPVFSAGNDQEVCKSNNYLTTGSQVNGSLLQWTTLGTGTFDNKAILITTYRPSSDDKNKGSVKLTLKVNAIAPCLSPGYDTVTLTFIDNPSAFAGNDTTICSSSFALIKASSSNSTQYEWSSSGSGTWNNKDILKPTYYPSPSDISNGSVTLTITTKNPTCPSFSDALKLFLTPFPVSEAGPDNVICEDRSLLLDGRNSANFSSLRWSTSGNGSFDNRIIPQASYTPSISDINKGSVKIYLLAEGLPPCNTPVRDSMTLSLRKNPFVQAGTDTIIGEGDVFKAINATAQNFNQVSWSTRGDGTFLNGSSIISTYTPGRNDLLNKGVRLVLTGTSNSPCVKVATHSIFVLITPKPSADAGADVNTCEGSDITISAASAQEYSEIWWTTDGTGVLKNASTFSPTYSPGMEDIENRQVVLTLHARGKEPIEQFVNTDNMVVHIIHNAFTDVLPLDTACENSMYQINDVIYRDINTIGWTSSGNGIFSGTGVQNPKYNFSTTDREEDTLYFYVKVKSILPCIHEERDTMMIRLYHEPEPSFDYDNPVGCAPLSVSFTNTSVGEELTYSWDLGNGMESNVEHPSDIIYQQGIIADTIYPIRLEAGNRCNSLSTSKEVIVKPIPITHFGMDVAWGCSPKEIYFFNVTTGLADKYLWKWGDGKDYSKEEQPESHVFETGKFDTTYTITLIAENECGVDSMQKAVKIFPNTVKSFFATDTTFGCAPLKVTFTNGSTGVLGNKPFLVWAWDFGYENNRSTEMNPVHIFENPGIYKVGLYVHDSCSYDTFYTEINVKGAPRVEFSAEKTEYCEHDTVLFTATSAEKDYIASLTWNFGDLNQRNGYTAKHIYDSAGIFNISLTAMHIFNGCTFSTSKNITINKSPIAAFSIPENDGCQPLQITFLNESEGGDYYSWNFGNGNRSIDINGQQTFTDAGTYNINLRASNIEGCSDTVNNSLNVNPKPVTAFESSSLLTCFPPVDIGFTNLTEGADDYMWNFGNGNSSKDTNPSITYSEYGDYLIKLVATNMYFCTDTSEMVYHVYHNPVAEFSVDTTIGCDPFIVPFKNLSEYGVDYYWSFEDLAYSVEENPVYSFKGEGIYTVSLKVVGLGGCNNSIIKEDYITTNPSPISDFDYTIINGIDTVQFYNHSSGAISYLWNFGDGKSSEEESPWHRYYYYGIYGVSLTTINEYSCANTLTDSINFILFKGLFFPNAFSPGNTSEELAVFKPVGIGLMKYHLVIYDTWGNMVWETTRLDKSCPAEAWDGTLNGKLLSPNVYVWHLKEAIYKDGTGYKGERYGTITLIK